MYAISFCLPFKISMNALITMVAVGILAIILLGLILAPVMMDTF